MRVSHIHHPPHLLPPCCCCRALIPMHPDLQYAGMLPPLDAPHHLRSTEWGPYREGVVRRSARGQGSFVDVGLDQDAHIAQVCACGGWGVGGQWSVVGEQTRWCWRWQVGQVLGERRASAASANLLPPATCPPGVCRL